MPVTLDKTVDYDAVVADLERQISDGQRAFDAWLARRKDLVAAIESIQRLTGVASTKSTVAGPEPSLDELLGVVEVPEPNQFRGLNYREAVLRAFEFLGRPTTAPEVADVLFKAGFAVDRKRIKWSVDGMFSTLRKAGKIVRQGGKHALVA